MFLLKKHKLHLSHLFCCNRTCYCANMVSVTSKSCNATLYNVSVLDVHPWSVSTEFRRIGRGRSDCAGVLTTLFLLTNVFHRGMYGPPLGPIASQRGFVPEFLRKPIATWDFVRRRGPGYIFIPCDKEERKV